MERMVWSDERLDDFSRRIDAGFDRNDRDVRDLRGDMGSEFVELRREMNAGFAQLRAEMATGAAELRAEMATGNAELRAEMATGNSQLRGEMATGNAALRGEIGAMRLTMIRVGGGMMVGLLGVIAAILGTGG